MGEVVEIGFSQNGKNFRSGDVLSNIIRLANIVLCAGKDRLVIISGGHRTDHS